MQYNIYICYDQVYIHKIKNKLKTFCIFFLCCRLHLHAVDDEDGIFYFTKVSLYHCVQTRYFIILNSYFFIIILIYIQILINDECTLYNTYFINLINNSIHTNLGTLNLLLPVYIQQDCCTEIYHFDGMLTAI